MIRLLWSCLCLAAISGAVTSQQTLGASLDESLAAARAAYQRGDHAEARRALRRALPSAGGHEGALWHDLGNCAFQLERFAEALWCYRRALALLPDEPRIEQNLRLSERRLGVAAIAEPLAGDLARALPQGLWLALACALQTAGLLGILAAGRGRPARRIGWSLIWLLGLVAAFPVIDRSWLGPPGEAVVLEAETGLHVEPHRDERVLLRLPAGALVRVIEASDRWVRIEHARGSGWLPRGALGFVGPDPELR